MSRFFILVLLALTARGFGEIREIRSLKEALPFIEPGTLLVFDLDNTLIEPVGNVGSDQWYYYLVRVYREVYGLGEAAAHREAGRVWNGAQSSIQIRTVEPGTARFVQQQQARGIPMVGLTARDASLAKTTLAHLRSVDVQLDRRPVFPGNSFGRSPSGTRFEGGVLFIGEHNVKGVLLTEMLRRLKERPKRVVFVDDKVKHVRSVDLALRNANIECIALRYGAADAKVERFNRSTRTLEPSRKPTRRWWGSFQGRAKAS